MITKDELLVQLHPRSEGNFIHFFQFISGDFVIIDDAVRVTLNACSVECDDIIIEVKSAVRKIDDLFEIIHALKSN